ncbi:hypothetical protein I317_01513 [Kwoniella heveanensis CBS 569]|nr:hypothetical protein I317_01513 [Kwoniella heveanensis CBS 569]
MKFGRYLAENQTPEWKRAYIDYRACKKAIKVVARRLGQVKESGGEGGAGDGDGDGDDSSGADDDHGPSAPPRDRSTPDTIKGSLTRRLTRTISQGATPRLTRFSSRPSETRSPRYGSTGTSPRPPTSAPRVPPPLDLGAPGVDDQDHESHSRPSPNPEEVLNADKSQTQDEDRVGGRDKARSRKGVAFSPKADAVVQATIEESSGESGRSSDVGMAQSDSNEPLTGGLDRDKESPKKIGQSPKRTPGALWSPRLGGASRNNDSPRTAESSRVTRSPRLGARSLRSMTLPSPALPMKSPGPPVRTADNFDELYKQLEDDEKAFFDLLESELDKVEKFYVARETEATRRAHALRDQLRELAEHRKIYHELYPQGIPEWEAKVGRILPIPAVTQGSAPGLAKLRARLGFSSNDEGENGTSTSKPDGSYADGAAIGRTQSPVMNENERRSLREAMAADKDHQTYSPERYQKYKKDLRNALLEFYRQLELIKNYRIMNLTGFRKALKKFEKTTKIVCLEMYTDERISKATFSKSGVIDGLIKQIEDLYTAHFEHGDSKKARERLRKQTHEKTHYSSVFRSGIMLGIAAPAAIAALVECDKPQTRAELPAWGGLLQVYAGLYLPVVFAILFELNLGAYVSARINYEFVMELSRPTIDYRSFLEIPAFLFLTLSYCFYFTFARVGAENIAPTTWPAAWLVFVAVFFLNPLPVLRRGTRYWLLRVLFRVCTPGYSRVEFIAFFLADELNSLIYSIQNIYFLSCGYAHKWPSDVFGVCKSGKTWPYALLLCLPAASRFVQCVKRYHDSQLKIHLINAGKYLSVILQQCLFVYWRSRGSILNDKAFIVWIIVAMVSSSYTCTWDFVIDWSLFRPQAGLLRKDLGYSHRYVYYLAMFTNLLIRFVFVWYIPYSTKHVRLRSFFFALAEMLRRWQWNFFRVETEHLGNADAYRVTREIPLPYRRLDHDSDDDDEDGPSSSSGGLAEKSKGGSRGGGSRKSFSVQLDRIRHRLRERRSTSGNGGGGGSGTILGHEDGESGLSGGRGPDAIDAGPRGHAPQREYEARRPGDSMRSESEIGPGSNLV